LAALKHELDESGIHCRPVPVAEEVVL
jgi:hypothetical protein